MSVAGSQTPRWLKYQSGNLQLVLVQAGPFAAAMAEQLSLEGIAARALAELSLSALAIASSCPLGERARVAVESTGYVRRAYVEANAAGAARGAIETGDQPSNPPWGPGTLTIARTRSGGLPTREQSMPFVDGDLAGCLRHYWSRVEKVPAAIGILVQSDAAGRLIRADGAFLQATEGATEREIEHLHRWAPALSSIAKSLSTSADPFALATDRLDGLELEPVDVRPLRFNLLRRSGPTTTQVS